MSSSYLVGISRIWHLIKIMFSCWSFHFFLRFNRGALLLYFIRACLRAELKNFYSDFCHVLWFGVFFFFSVHFFVLHVSPSYFHQSEFISSSSNSSVTVDDNDVYVCAANVTWTESIPYRICNNVSTLNDWSEALNYSFNILLFAWRR